MQVDHALWNMSAQKINAMNLFHNLSTNLWKKISAGSCAIHEIHLFTIPIICITPTANIPSIVLILPSFHCIGYTALVKLFDHQCWRDLCHGLAPPAQQFYTGPVCFASGVRTWSPTRSHWEYSCYKDPSRSLVTRTCSYEVISAYVITEYHWFGIQC